MAVPDKCVEASQWCFELLGEGVLVHLQTGECIVLRRVYRSIAVAS